MKYALIYEQSSVVVLARVKRVGSNAYLTIASTSMITVTTYNASTGTLIATTLPTVATSVFDTLQTDNRWRVDELGYNVAFALSQAHFPDGNTNYGIEVLIQPTDGFDVRFKVNVRTEDLLSV